MTGRKIAGCVLGFAGVVVINLFSRRVSSVVLSGTQFTME